MKTFIGLLQKQQRVMRDNIFKQNGTDFGYNRNNGEWMAKTRNTARVVVNAQASMLKQEMQQSPALKIIKHVVTNVGPKTFAVTLMKMKIQMQTLLGNVFGFSFRGLEASKQKLERV